MSSSVEETEVQNESATIKSEQRSDFRTNEHKPL